MNILADASVRDHFSKIFEFVSSPEYVLPRHLFGHVKWKIQELEDLKHELNLVKSNLNDFPLGEWHAHTRKMNLAGSVFETVKRRADPEFPTQAWCKFFDMASKFELVPEEAVESRNFSSVHLCEAPGAFIAALNHLLKLNFDKIKWNWLGNTLNPYYEGNSLLQMISDDRFISNTLERWWFGADFTGNLRDKLNLRHLIERVEATRPIWLVTADGSVDCNDNLAEQEANVVPLHYCEIVSALNILGKGGNFILKIFTTFECDSVNLLYLLRCSFSRLICYKPVASKEGNSEVYLICLNYKGKEELGKEMFSQLNEKYGSYGGSDAMFKRVDVPQKFIDEVIECASLFKSHQVSVIQRNIITYEKGLTKCDARLLHQVRRKIAERFIQEFKVAPIPSEQRIVVVKMTKSLHWSPRDESGSYSQNQDLKTSDESHIADCRNKLLEFQCKWAGGQTEWKAQDVLEETPVLDVIHCKPYNAVRSSSFCSNALVKTYQEILALAHKYNVDCDECSHNSDDTVLNCDYSKWLTDNEVTKKEFVAALVGKLSKCQTGDSLTLTGFCLLTHFNVGLLLLLFQAFEGIKFDDPRGNNRIVLMNMKSGQAVDIMRKVQDSLNTGSIHSLVKMFHLNVSENSWTGFIFLFNQWVIKINSLKLINTLWARMDCTDQLSL